jgi:hypothetical protein
MTRGAIRSSCFRFSFITSPSLSPYNSMISSFACTPGGELVDAERIGAGKLRHFGAENGEQGLLHLGTLRVPGDDVLDHVDIGQRDLCVAPIQMEDRSGLVNRIHATYSAAVNVFSGVLAVETVLPHWITLE